MKKNSSFWGSCETSKRDISLVWFVLFKDKATNIKKQKTAKKNKIKRYENRKRNCFTQKKSLTSNEGLFPHYTSSIKQI